MIDVPVWKKAWAILSPHERRRALVVLAIMLTAALASAAMVGSVLPFLSVLAQPERIETVGALSWAYQTFGFTSRYDFLIALGLGSLGVIVLANIILVISSYAIIRYVSMRIHWISHKLLAHYLGQPYTFFLDRHSGDLATNILSETQLMVNQFFRPAADLIASSLTVTAIVSLLIWVNPPIAVASFSLVGLTYGATYMISRRYVRRLGQMRAKGNQARFKIANEALGGVKDIKLLGREGSYVDRYLPPSLDMARSTVGVGVISDIPRYVIQTVVFGGVILLCLAIMDPAGLDDGALLGGLLPLIGVFAFAAQRLIPELQKLYNSLTRLQYGAAAVERIHSDLTSAPRARMPKKPPQALGLKADLQMKNVQYQYPGGDGPSLTDIDLTIKAKEKIGIVGSTGAGKTTMADMILGLLRPTSGQIIVDGQEITDEKLRQWQATVGYVPQDIFLTDSSLYENIALGVPPDEVDRDRVEEAGRIAQLDEFVQRDLPEKYDTKIGERGVRLSGGQRQRIGIARALYHDADLIVLDEATSALDNLTEREVMSAINALPDSKTIVMIAHRLSTVKVCDRIVVLDKGHIVETGPWNTLMEEGGAFHAIAMASSDAA